MRILTCFFQLNKNLQQVFSKFLDKGKATIRVKEPPHDLFINKVQVWAWVESAGSMSLLFNNVACNNQQ